MAVSIVGTKFRAWSPVDGSPLAFGKVYTYQAGTNTPKVTYTTEGQETENANPVILNAAGYANIYLDGSYKIVVTDSDDVEVHTTDPVSDPSQLGKEWVYQKAATFVSATSFTVPGNHTSEYIANRRLQALTDDGYIYGMVTSSSYTAGLTTVVVSMDSTALSASLVRVWLSIIKDESKSLSLLSGLLAATLEKLAQGIMIDGKVIDFTEITKNGTIRPIISVAENNATSGNGKTDYSIWLETEALAAGYVIDGTGAPNYRGLNHYVGGGTAYVAIRNKTKSVIMDWLDTTGATSHTDEILAYLNAGFEVKLPAGIIGGSTISIPIGAKISGSGAPRYDDTVSLGWDNFGTLLTFGINVDDCQDFELSDFSVDDTVGDGVSGSGVSLGRGKISRVNTKTTSHSFLFNLLCPDPDGALDPANNVVGGIDVEDCEHWGGVNAFVSKHHNVTFRRCKSHGTSSQSFVAISDNINGATTYNRATFTTFDRCWSDGSANDFRCYTRDVFSADPVNNVNTNVVKACSYTRFVGCGSEDTSQYPVLLGDFDSASYASMQVENVTIEDHADSLANFGFIRVEKAKNVKICSSHFRTGANVVVNDAQCENVIIDDSNTIESGCTGDEVAPFIINNNSSSVNFSFWRPNLLWRFVNTISTSVTTFTTICYGKPITFWIDDEFTSIILNGLVYTGKGTRITAVNTAGTWRIISCAVDICDGVQNVPFVGSGVDFSFNARRNKTLSCTLTGTLANVTSSISNLHEGASVFLRFVSDGSTRNITTFDSTFVFTSSAPTSVPANQTVLINFYKHGSKLIELNKITYATP